MPPARSTAQSPSPAPARVVASGPANAEPLLSIAFPNTCTLSKPLLAQLGLSGMGSVRFHLVVPAQLGGDWYLDTLPRPGVGAKLPERGAARFRIQQVAKRHFMQARPLMAPTPGAPFQGNANVFVNLLHFRLGEQVAGQLGYYHLHQVTGPVHH